MPELFLYSLELWPLDLRSRIILKTIWGNSPALQEPFRLGDFVRVIGIEGIVSDIQARATVVTAREGRQVVIPDATIFHQPRGRRPQSRNKPRTVTRDRS